MNSELVSGVLNLISSFRYSIGFVGIIGLDCWVSGSIAFCRIAVLFWLVFRLYR